MAEVVFRSTHPDVLAAPESWRAAMADWHTRSDALLTEMGFTDRKFLVVSYMTSRNIAGVEYRAGDEVPNGWRLANRDGHEVLVPEKRRAAGKATAARIEECHPPSFPNSYLPGMPAEHWVGNRILAPEVREMGGAVWVKWRCESVPGVDEALWERAPLSKYWAAREAQDAEAVASDG